MARHFDFAVVGAGPAGVVTTCELQRLGYRVALVQAPRRVPAIEGLAERTCRGLEHAGCCSALATASDPVPRTAEWNNASFDGNRERLVDRASFDRALLDDARSAGAFVHSARVAHAERSAEGWSLRTRSERIDLHAAYLVDARGRGAAKCATEPQAGPDTFALGRLWRLAEPVVSHSHVKTFRDGWAWLAVAGDRALLQVFVSTVARGLPAKPALPARYADLMAQLPDYRRFLQTATPMGSVFARSARTTFCPQAVDAHQARVGDATLTIDPLAGHGMFEAVGGALALAATLNTVQRYPQRSALAMSFYRDKVHHDYRRMARTARDFYRLEQRWADSDFWRERCRWPDDEPSHASPDAGTAVVATRAVNDGGVIVERDVVVTPDHPRGVWQLAGVELVPLLRLIDGRENTSAAELARLAGGALGVPEEGARQALTWLQMRGVLLPRGP